MLLDQNVGMRLIVCNLQEGMVYTQCGISKMLDTLNDSLFFFFFSFITQPENQRHKFLSLTVQTVRSFLLGNPNSFGHQWVAGCVSCVSPHQAVLQYQLSVLSTHLKVQSGDGIEFYRLRLIPTKLPALKTPVTSPGC